MSASDANFHARDTTDARYGQAQKVKLNRKEYQDIIETTYLLAQTNEIKEMRAVIIKNIDQAPEIILGELDIMLKKRWDELCDTRFGRKTFIKMDLMDIIEGTHVKNFCKKSIAVKGSG